MIGSAQCASVEMIVHLKLELDVDAELTKSFCLWLVDCLGEIMAAESECLYTHDQVHKNMTPSCLSR